MNLVLKLYSFLTCILGLIILPFIFLLRLIQKKDVTSWKIKMGNFDLPKNFDKSKKTIMIHGVSVGEVVSLEKLIRKVKEEFPNHNLVLTTGTKTGQETAIKKMGDVADFITYFPLDIKFFVEKFLDKINPDVILIAETEIWPIFIYTAKKRNIKTYIINGRMSDESFKMYKILKPFFKNVLPMYSGIFVQSEIDKARLNEAGANINQLDVMKNLKFDVNKFDVDIDLNTNNSKVLIAGSTHKGEDEIVLRVYKKLKELIPNLKLLLAPRHITRTPDVQNLIKSFNFSYNLYSKNKQFSDNSDILLLDVMGELAKLYAKIDVAFIGGSFNNTGGHNPLEAIIFDKPTISGPSIKNFRDIYAILKMNNAAFVVNNEEEFFEIAKKLLLDENYYQEIKNNANKAFKNQQGALNFVIDKLKKVI
ncbi:TPA: 3-deoxy-D-manno-octulosonic acid transferase [Candidatus Galligastranaerophilus intestinigallinarum]|nr:3-deoxy-D-manno-octulosonic acid transferase [Candidatus Galligastranaerophilus intestinigallinarum]